MRKKAKRAAHPLLTCILLTVLLALCILLLCQAERRYQEAAYPLPYSQTVLPLAKEYGVDPYLVYGVIFTESRFQPDAVSSANAKGLMQLTDETYQWALQRTGNADSYDPQKLFQPEENLRWGICVLSLLSEQFSDTDTLLAAYNAGQGEVKKWLADPRYSTDGVTLSAIPFGETEEYVKRVKEAREHYNQLYHLD